MKINQKGKVPMLTMKSSSKVARETLDAINKAFNDIIEKLLDRPEKILITARMIDNEHYYRKRAVLSKDWLHAAIVKFSGVPKSEMMTILLEARRQTPMCTPWTEDLLREADKFYQLRGVERLFMYMGNLMSDQLPVKCHYRPLLRAAMVHRMVSVPFSASSRIDAVSGEIQFECYKFDVEQHNQWTRIHNLNSQSAPIPEDFTVRVHGKFTITNNWSMYGARFKGQRVDQPIFCSLTRAWMWSLRGMPSPSGLLAMTNMQRGREVIVGRWPEEHQVNRAKEVAE